METETVALDTESTCSEDEVMPTETDTEVVEIEIPTETESETETTEVAEVDNTESTRSEKVEFEVVAMEATKYAKSSVNVRKGPSSDYEKIGSLFINQKVKVTGQADTGWYQIELDGEVAYVSNNYLVNEKVAVNTTPSTNNNTATNTDSENDADSGGSKSDYVASNAGSGDVGEDVVSGSAPEWTDEEIEDFWDDAENIDGSFEPVTDGYGPGVEIEITPTH